MGDESVRREAAGAIVARQRPGPAAVDELGGVEQPRHESYGSVAVFVDAFGNKWDLIGR